MLSPVASDMLMLELLCKVHVRSVEQHLVLSLRQVAQAAGPDLTTIFLISY